jgi:hypothetical protein
MRKFKNDEDEQYKEFLKAMNFNPEQVEFIFKQYKNYEQISQEEEFYYDTYERDMWYTMNRSGLFEKDDEENKSGITSWNSNHTRLYITER